MPQGQYNAYQWRDDLGGSTEEQYVRNSYNNMGRWANQLSNFGSQLYQNYGSYLDKTTQKKGVGDWLAMYQAGSGGNYAGGMVQSIQQKNAFDARRRDSINTGVQGFAGMNMQQISQLLSGQGQIANQAYGTKTQKEAIEAQEGGVLDIAGPILGGLAGSFLGPIGMAAGASLGGSLFGGGGTTQQTHSQFGGGTTIGAQWSDIRLKENIEDTGEKTKDGIRIVNFNYKGKDQRFRGVIAQEVEKVRPELVKEINGYLTVNYGDL